MTQPKDQPVDELRSLLKDFFAVDLHESCDDSCAHKEKMEQFINSIEDWCQAECNRAKLAENRYTEKYWRVDFPDDGDMTTFLDNRRKELQQLMKGER